jgi:hypothetical protein
VRLSELIGRWEKGGVSAYGYRDAVTNDYPSGYGSAQQHEVRADGGFDYSNYATVSLSDAHSQREPVPGRRTVPTARAGGLPYCSFNLHSFSPHPPIA